MLNVVTKEDEVITPEGMECLKRGYILLSYSSHRADRIAAWDCDVKQWIVTNFSGHTSGRYNSVSELITALNSSGIKVYRLLGYCTDLQDVVGSIKTHNAQYPS